MADKPYITIPVLDSIQHITGTSAPRISITEHPEVTAKVVKALHDGLGVEDMHASGIADIEYARTVVRRLREAGLINYIYRPRGQRRGPRK